MPQDYYQTLGLDRSASAEEIKKAYRKMAHKYHPDKAGGDEAKFKEVNQAYQVLGNAQKKSQYDQFGQTFDGASSGPSAGGFSGFSGFGSRAGQGSYNASGFGFEDIDLGDIFSSFFGGGRTRAQSARPRQAGADIKVDLNISFKDSFFGVEQSINLYKYDKCDHCHGNGAEPGTPINTCSTCQGQGQVRQVRQTMLGSFAQTSVCPDCRGEGKKAETPCSSCSGQGRKKVESALKVKIPAGIADGQTIKLDGQGEAGINGAANGDLYVSVHVDDDKNFTREENNLILETNISFPEAALGVNLPIKSFDEELSLKIPAGTQSGTTFSLDQKGFPALGGFSRGDLLVKVSVETPKKINQKQRELLKQFASEGGQNIEFSEKEGIIDKIFGKK